MSRVNPPNSLWPIGARVTMLDAWGLNPVAGRVTAHYGDDQIRVEDFGGIVHTGQTWRIVADTTTPDEIEALV